MEKRYDIVVVGGGHAGTEASLAGSRLGLSVLLVAFDTAKLGFMSCNPAIGGVGKGQLVKEIDALGGEMAKAADYAALQFRILNSSKGPAVWSSRAQTDRERYRRYINDVIRRQKNLDIFEGEATRFFTSGGKIKSVELNGEVVVETGALIISTGTFLEGLIHIGDKHFHGGRIEEQKSSVILSETLRESGFNMLRFKTGTCARLISDTINFTDLIKQEGDNPPRPFSFSSNFISIDQKPCYITYTNKETHRIIRGNLKHSALYSGVIKGTGVRYCPSIEDKIVKFAHHDRHRVFLEPESNETGLCYPNGISTSLPCEIQDEFIHTISGLEDVKVASYGYGIEHNVVDPAQLFQTLETKKVGGLFLAGQINGTTGYEEAAAQGLIAGINAAMKIRGLPPLILSRTDSYIGVLIDDLTSKGTMEPYRMFTSRAEYRLMLREDNADLRLAGYARSAGLLSAERIQATENKKAEIDRLIEKLKTIRMRDRDGNITLFDYLRKPGIDISILPGTENFSQEVLFVAQTEVKYAPYIERMLRKIKDFKDLEKVKIPGDTDYRGIPGLSTEIIEKLSCLRPSNLAQANNISGITPAAIAILIIHLRR